MSQMTHSADIVHAIERWFNDIPIEESQREWFNLIEQYSPVALVSALAALKWENVHDLLVRLAPINQKRKAGRPVKTLGVYYYRMRNGGIERCISLLIPLWQKAGYNVVLITEEPATPDDYILPEGITRVILRKACDSQKEDYGERAQNWESIVNTYQIDTIIYKAWVSPLLFWDALCLKALKLNLVVESHNTFGCLFRLQMPHRYELPPTYRLVDRVVVLSRVFANFWNNYCPAYYIPNITTLCPKENCAPLHSQTILWVGRIAQEKHPLDAVKVFSQIHKSNPNASLIMLGSGDDPVLQCELENEIQGLALDNFIQLTGYVTNVSPYYQKASLLLFTSDYEGFPMVLAEAKSYGLPIIMYDLPYLEMARDQRGIITVAPGDTKSMAQNAIDLLSESGIQKRLQLGKQSRKSAEDFASFDQTRAWKQVFDSLQNPEKADIKMTSEDNRLMMDLLLSEIACSEEKFDSTLNNILEGKRWLEHHSKSQGLFIQEQQHAWEERGEALKQVQEAKVYLEQHCEVLEKVIQEQRRAWEERGDALKQVQEANEQLKQRCDQQEAIILEQTKALSSNTVVRLMKQICQRMAHIFNRLVGKEQ